jgi:hypothetical protein
MQVVLFGAKVGVFESLLWVVSGESSRDVHRRPGDAEVAGRWYDSYGADWLARPAVKGCV